MEQPPERARDTKSLALGLALVAVYCVLRTVAAPDELLAAWTVAACVAALWSPLAGLTVLAAIAPFTEALTDDGRISATPFLLATLGGSLIVRILLQRRLPRPSLALSAGLGLFALTLLGVLVSTLAYGTARGAEAFEAWVPGIGGGLTAMLVAAWLAWRGEISATVVAVAAITLGALVSVVDFFGRGTVEHSIFGWLLHHSVDPHRLRGIIDAPNPAAALFLVGLAVTLGALVFGRQTWLRLLAGLASACLLLAMVATASRSAVIALVVVLALLAWRWRRWLGLALMTAAASLALLLASGNSVVRTVPQIFDEARLDAWRASIAMWLAAPLGGQGFRSFEWLHATYGSTLDAPHNEWLRLFAEEGTLAGLVGVLFAVSVVVMLLRDGDWLTAAIGAAAAALFIMACFNNPFWYTQVTAPAFLILGSGLGLAIGRAERRARAPCAG